LVNDTYLNLNDSLTYYMLNSNYCKYEHLKPHQLESDFRKLEIEHLFLYMSRTRGVPFQKKTVQRDVSTLQHFPHQWPYRLFLLGYFKFMYRNSYLPIACPPFSDWMKSRFPTSHDLRSSIHIHLAYVIAFLLSNHSMGTT
jgi:hypothetical protein